MDWRRDWRVGEAGGGGRVKAPGASTVPEVVGGGGDGGLER